MGEGLLEQAGSGSTFFLDIYRSPGMFYECRKCRFEPAVSSVSSTEPNKMLNVQETQYPVYRLVLKSVRKIVIFNAE